jgi:hypothetical protein
MKLHKIVFVAACALLTVKSQYATGDFFRDLIYQRPVYQASISGIERLRADGKINVRMLSRYLKEAIKHPCLLITEDQMASDVTSALFPGASVCSVKKSAKVEDICTKIRAFSAECGKYAVVFTNIASMNDALAEELRRTMPEACVLAVDELFAHVDAVDMQKLQNFMRRRIHIVCSAAIIPVKAERRRQQYIRSMQILIDYGYNPYVAESCVAGPTFFDDYTKNVCYTMSNDDTLRNKGVNESVSMLKGLESWNFDDNDIVLKLTGRYFLLSDEIIRLLEDDEDVDALARFEVMDRSSVLTGCYAMRCGLMKEMYNSYDYEKLEREMICIEHEVGPSLDALEANRGIKLIRSNHLGVEANVFGEFGMDHSVYW